MFEPSEQVYDAIQFAARAHRGQVRKANGVPYIVHPLGAARLLIEYGCTHEEAVVAAILHDVVEDTDATLEELRVEFGSTVADFVEALSEPDKSAPWEARKRHTIHTLKEAPQAVLLVSCADKLDNLSSIAQDVDVRGDEAWSAFKRGAPEQAWYYRSLADVFSARLPRHPMVERFAQLVEGLFEGITSAEVGKSQ